MHFELRDHTADVAVAATGSTIEAVFAAVGEGLAAASCDEIPATGGERFEFAVKASGREALLFDYLDQLIYERDVRSVLPVDNRVRAIEESTDADGSTVRSLTASARGVPLDGLDAREVKAVTYSEMRLEQVGEAWEAYVVFDV